MRKIAQIFDEIVGNQSEILKNQSYATLLVPRLLPDCIQSSIVAVDFQLKFLIIIGVFGILQCRELVKF